MPDTNMGRWHAWPYRNSKVDRTPLLCERECHAPFHVCVLERLRNTAYCVALDTILETKPLEHFAAVGLDVGSSLFGGLLAFEHQLDLRVSRSHQIFRGRQARKLVDEIS